MNPLRLVWRRRALALLAVASILSSADFAVPVSTLFLLSRGLDFTEVFTLETVLVVSLLLCDLPTGWLADRTSDRAVLVTGHAVAALAAVGWALSHGFVAFALTTVLSGLGIALVSGADRSYLTSVLDEGAEQQLTGVLGHFGALAALSAAGAGAVGGLLAAHGLAWPAAVAAAAEIGAALVVLGLPAAHRADPADSTGQRPSLSQVARLVARTPVLALSALQPWILVGAAYYLNQPRWQATGIDVRWFGAILALAQVAEALCSHLADTVARRLSSRLLVSGSLAASAVGFMLMTLPHPFAGVAGFVLVLASGALRAPVTGSLTALAAPLVVRATTLSMVSTCASLIGAVVNPLVGLMAQSDVVLACWAVAAGLMGFAVAWAVLGPRGVGADQP